MKSSLTLVLATLLFVVLGCSLDKFTGKKDEVPTPVPEATVANDSNAGGPKESASSSSESGASDVSTEKFSKLELGMSYEQVKAIMGSPGTTLSETKSGSFSSASYEWKGDKFARISVRFTNDELTYKSQSGLSPASGTDEINQEKFNKINIGMTYDEVKAIIGSDGELTSQMKIGKVNSVNYRWKGERYSNIFASFKDGKLQNKTQNGLK
jgi:outer membrane protein assembly factor BamE (lipoprotein component of BamABCDE complex)